jgi:hypothetical protein
MTKLPKGVREEGLGDEEIISCSRKEAKKRQESADPVQKKGREHEGPSRRQSLPKRQFIEGLSAPAIV